MALIVMTGAPWNLRVCATAYSRRRGRLVTPLHRNASGSDTRWVLDDSADRAAVGYPVGTGLHSLPCGRSPIMTSTPGPRLAARAAHRLALGSSLFALSFVAAAGTLDDLSSKDAAGGLRAALSQGLGAAVTQLGANNGFLDDPKVAIPLPPTLEKADRALRMVGMSGEADELRATMNHAAEQAVAQARPVFEDAVRHMTLTDAKAILTGGDDAGTQYFRRTTS